MARAVDVAGYIIKSTPVDQLKLQKLLFYTQAVSLVKFGVPAFDDPIEAWDYGPVVSSIYNKYKKFCFEQITKPVGDIEALDTQTITSIDLMLGYYGKMTGPALINETHSEDPWRKAYAKGQNTVISQKSMRDYYKKIFHFSDD